MVHSKLIAKLQVAVLMICSWGGYRPTQFYYGPFPFVQIAAARSLAVCVISGANSIANPLCHIFSISFLDGCLPETCKYAIVTPVHKKGPTSDPNNFRPISLTTTCCRVMERIINDTLLRYLLDRRLISKQQHGFIRRKSVCTNLLECLEDWMLNLQSRHITDVIYFDFKKALTLFFTVN